MDGKCKMNYKRASNNKRKENKRKNIGPLIHIKEVHLLAILSLTTGCQSCQGKTYHIWAGALQRTVFGRKNILKHFKQTYTLMNIIMSK